MWLYLLLVIPLCYIAFIRSAKTMALPEGFFLFFLGSACSVVYSIIDFFVIQRLYIPTYSFGFQFAFSFFTGIVIPAFFALLIINLCSKGIISYRLRTVSSILCGCFAVFIPYHIIAFYPVLSIMQTFVYPTVFVAFLFFVDTLFFCLYTSIIQQKPLWTRITIIAILCVVTIIPALIEVLWKLHISTIAWILISAVYCVCAVGFWMYAHKGEAEA